MYTIVLTFITAFLMTFFGIPTIIRVAKKNHLMDRPGERRAHYVSTPSLGGIGIFAGTVFAIVMWTPIHQFTGLQYILSAFFIIFLVGAKDDIDPISVNKKLLGQILAACIIILLADIRITNLFGILGIGTLPYIPSLCFTLFFMLLVINSFNFIDGINGLAGSLGILIAVTIGTWFFQVDRIEMATIAYALSGALMAFLYYNYTPAKIFMGDTGSLLLGLIVSILCINCLEEHLTLSDRHPYALGAPAAVIIGIIIIPVFDAIRVLTMRILSGKAPHKADRTHIHHLLLRARLSHMQATAILIAVNLFFIAIVFRYQHIGNVPLILLILCLGMVLNVVLFIILVARKEVLSRHRAR